MSEDNHYTQVDAHEGDSFEDVARRLVASAPASTVYDGVEVLVEVDQSVEDVVKKYVRFRQAADVRKRVNQFAVSTVELVAVESPGPGGKIDPWREIRDPQLRGLYVLWERRPDHSVGNVSVVVCLPAENTVDGRRGLALQVQHGPVVAALGSLLLELSFRAAASEARLDALEAKARS